MKNEFKAGDLVFDVNVKNGINLDRVDNCCSGNIAYPIETNHESYTTSGHVCITEQIPSIFHATPENRQALVTLHGEDAVPKLPLRGSELTKKLLDRQKYVLCLVSHTSDDKARSNNPPKVRTVVGVDRDWFESVTGLMNKYAVPIDNNGNEITEIE